MTSVGCRYIYHKLRRQVGEHILLRALTVPVHVGEQLVLLGQQTMRWELVHELFLSVDTQLVEVDAAGDRCPLEAVQGQVGLLKLDPVAAAFEDT